MIDIIQDYIEDNFINSETLAELSENFSSYEVEQLFLTIQENGIETDANLLDINKYR